MSDRASVHRMVVDRMEGEFAATELDGASVIDLPRWLLPEGTREGDVIRVESVADHDSATIRLRLDPAATESARAAARERLQRLSNRDPGGPIDL